jgi:hypothetical protein
MPKYTAETYHPEHVENLLHERGFQHLRARKHGAAVVVESGPAKDAVKHFRVRRDTVHYWVLDIANHQGRWQRTPFRGLLDEMITLVPETFPWVLTDLGSN